MECGSSESKVLEESLPYISKGSRGSRDVAMCLLDKGLSWGSSRGLATPRVDLSGCRLGVISEQGAAHANDFLPSSSPSFCFPPFVSLDQVYVLPLLVPVPHQDGFKEDQHGPYWPGCTLQMAP